MVGVIMKERINIPCAPSLIESMRSIGYSFETAIADIVDNSIYADSKRIQIISRADTERVYLEIVDDGTGMDNEQLFMAMKYGSRNPNETRDEGDLGRFGLGMKSASLSQCRKFTVVSKKNGEVSAFQWDLDYIIQTNDWSIKEFAIDELVFVPGLHFLLEQESGTLVLWENFDRIESASYKFEKNFTELVLKVEEHIALVYHRLLGNKLDIIVNGNKVVPLDPFVTGNPATQRFREQKIYVGNSPISIRKFVLPPISSIKENEIIAAGGKNELKNNQGFYIYRNKRLIIWGTWFRLQSKEELYKLARVRVDIPNSLDDIWDIDIKKSRANIPNMIKDKLIKAVEDTVSTSEHAHMYKGHKMAKETVDSSWDVLETSEGIRLSISSKKPMVAKFAESLSQDQLKAFEKIVRNIENDIPYDTIYAYIAKGKSVNQDHKETNAEIDKLSDSITSMMDIWGMTKNRVIDMFLSTYKDSGDSKTIELLKKMRE